MAVGEVDNAVDDRPRDLIGKLGVHFAEENLRGAKLRKDTRTKEEKVRVRWRKGEMKTWATTNNKKKRKEKRIQRGKKREKRGTTRRRSP